MADSQGIVSQNLRLDPDPPLETKNADATPLPFENQKRHNFFNRYAIFYCKLYIFRPEIRFTLPLGYQKNCPPPPLHRNQILKLTGCAPTPWILTCHSMENKMSVIFLSIFHF